MWKRKLHILPSLPLKAIAILNKFIPGGKMHDIGLSAFDRDINCLLDISPIHLEFTRMEISTGDRLLKEIGILNNFPFICFFVRDSAYYNSSYDFTNYRNSDIDNYLLAAEYLTKKGFYVIRMGAKVNKPFNTNNNPMIIDYAVSGQRTEFLDIYLASKCFFCVTTGSGWDNLPNIFRRPIVYTNLLPIADFPSSSDRYLNITKSLISTIDGHELSLREIIDNDLLCTRDLFEYNSKNVKFIENSPEEILNVVVEMYERLNNLFIETNDCIFRQKSFWKIITTFNPKDKSGQPMHVVTKGRVGNIFLRNKLFLQY
jgi:putative glycosyltransferase (TIGR04372 family)